MPILCLGQVQIGQTINGEAQNDLSGNSVALSADGTIVAIGAINNTGSGIWSGQVRVYNMQGDTWVQMGQDIDGESANDKSGADISLSSDGTILAIGAPSNDVNGDENGFAGHVRVYNYDGNSWVQMGQDINGLGVLDEFGSSLSISSDGTRVAIGGPSNDGAAQNAGHVRVFDFEGGSWVSVGQTIQGVAQNDDCGADVELSADGNILAVGSPLFDVEGINAMGQVIIYENQSDTWVQLGNAILGEIDLDFMGDKDQISLSEDGSIIAIGTANGDNVNGIDAGNVKVYNFNGSDWEQIGEDILGQQEAEELGTVVELSLDGSILATSAIFSEYMGNNGIGRVQLFQNIDNNWMPLGETIYGTEDDDICGSGIGFSDDGSFIAIGSLGNDNVNGQSAGHTRIFDLRDEILSSSTEVTDLNNFKLFPNPTSTITNIQLPNGATIKNVNIYNIMGQLVMQTKLSQIDISKLEAGTYIVKIITKLEAIGVQKLIVK